MNTTTPSAARPSTSDAPEWPPRTAAEFARLRERAIEQAPALRSEAIAEFWRGTDAWFSGAVDHTRRAADRLAARLRHHHKQRGQTSACGGALKA